MSELFAGFVRWTIDAVYSFGYFGLGFLVMLGNLHLPFPTGITLPLAGFLVEQGRFSFILVMIAATAGAVAGSLVLYFLGRWFGEERLRRLVGRFERFKIVSTSHLDKADEMFERHGGKAILIGHLVPGVGAFISIPAGVTRMPIWGQFMVYTTIGSIPYNVAQVLLGWVLGSQWRQAEQYASNVKYLVPVVLMVGIFWFLARRLERRWEARLYVPVPGGREGRRRERQGGRGGSYGRGDLERRSSGAWRARRKKKKVPRTEARKVNDRGWRGETGEAPALLPGVHAREDALRRRGGPGGREDRGRRDRDPGGPRAGRVLGRDRGGQDRARRR